MPDDIFIASVQPLNRIVIPIQIAKLRKIDGTKKVRVQLLEVFK